MVQPGIETGVAWGLLCKYPAPPQEQRVGALNLAVACRTCHLQAAVAGPSAGPDTPNSGNDLNESGHSCPTLSADSYPNSSQIPCGLTLSRYWKIHVSGTAAPNICQLLHGSPKLDWDLLGGPKDPECREGCQGQRCGKGHTHNAVLYEDG